MKARGPGVKLLHLHTPDKDRFYATRGWVLMHDTSLLPHPAQQESCFTSLANVWAASLSPSTMVR